MPGATFMKGGTKTVGLPSRGCGFDVGPIAQSLKRCQSWERELEEPPGLFPCASSALIGLPCSSYL